MRARGASRGAVHELGTGNLEGAAGKRKLHVIAQPADGAADHHTYISVLLRLLNNCSDLPTTVTKRVDSRDVAHHRILLVGCCIAGLSLLTSPPRALAWQLTHIDYRRGIHRSPPNTDCAASGGTCACSNELSLLARAKATRGRIIGFVTHLSLS